MQLCFGKGWVRSSHLTLSDPFATAGRPPGFCNPNRERMESFWASPGESDLSKTL